MYNFDLETRLQRLNPRLYIERRVVNKGLKEFTLTGIYLKQPRRKKINISQADIHYAKDGGDKYLYDIQSGARDQYVCGVALEWVPEYDWFEWDDQLNEMNLVAPGWRRIVTKLVSKGLTTFDRARKVFRCSSLGEHTYDKLGFAARQKQAYQEMKRGDRHTVRI